MKDSVDKTLRGVLLAVALLCLLSLRLSSVVEPSDDSYITLRTVNNLLHGEGFVYNVGERVLGTTTPLYTLVIAGASWISGIEPVSVARMFGLFCDLANLLLFFILANSLFRKPLFLSGLATLAYSLCWNTTVSSLILMETPFFVSLLLLTCLASLGNSKKLRVLACSAATLSCLVRPEGVLLVFSVILYRSYLVDRRRFSLPVLELLTFSFLILPWLIFSIWYFGSPIPHSVMAKRIAYLRPFFGTGMSFSAHFARIFSANYLPWYCMIPLVGTAMCLVWRGGKQIVLEGSPFQIPLVFLSSFLVLYTLANPLIFEWYLSPLEPAYLLLMLVGVKHYWSSARGGCLLFLGIVIFNLFMQYPSVINVESRTKDSVWLSLARGDQEDYSFVRPFRSFEEREYLYVKIAAMLQNLGPDKSVLAPEFGAFGYFSSARIVSAIGHVNPEVLRFLPVPKSKIALDSAIPVAMVRATRPDYIFSLEIFIRHTLLVDPWFRRHYEVVKIFPSSMFYSKGVYLFRRIAAERLNSTAIARLSGSRTPFIQ
jgi:hypothetical protein